MAAIRAIACLAPCLVATFDRLPGVLNVWGAGEPEPLWGFADLLIVDEAGQCAPDKGAAAFALAKRAVVVGDVLQLPPVEPDDSTAFEGPIARASGVADDAWYARRGTVCGVSKRSNEDGSIMRVASAASAFSSDAPGEGMWLLEHFRCDHRIIAYCNDGWYRGRLRPSRPIEADETRILPPFLHQHVAGTSVGGGSRRNPAEARGIAEWLAARADEIEARYGLPLARCVAVVTPFRAQAWLIASELKQLLGTRADGMTVGTVHALQGAERPIVVFSTVYTANDQVKSFFFDREWTMLNVAVSRAKDTFVVAGDRGIFAPNRAASEPSSRLAAYLFASVSATNARAPA